MPIYSVELVLTRLLVEADSEDEAREIAHPALLKEAQNSGRLAVDCLTKDRFIGKGPVYANPNIFGDID